MTVSIVEATTRAAFEAATAQQTKCEAVIAPWGGGNVTARVLGSGGALRQTVTLGPWVIAPTTPREVRHGARLAFTTVSTGDIERIEYRTAGGVTIFTASAGEGATAAAVDFAGPIRNLCGVTLSGAVFTADPALPVTPQPDALLDLMAAARAAVAPTEWTWVKANTNEIQAVFPPLGLRDDFAGGDTLQYVVTAWGGWVWNPDALAFEINGTGHSAAGNTEWFRWNAVTRQWQLGYYGSEQIACPDPYYRAPDFNGTPPSAHPYDNQCYGKVRKRVYQAYAGIFNSGNRGRVWRPSEPGVQSNGADGQPGANFTGIFEIDMAQAGTGKVLGATGSNPARGANAGTVLPGANAALLHDWYGVGGPAPVFEGQTMALTVESSMAYTDEVAGKDAFYWTAGNKWLVRTTINSSNPADDTHELICRDGSVYGAGRGSVQISFDPVRRVVIAITNDADTNPGTVVFCDLKRTLGASNGWRQATLTGAALAEWLAADRLDMGIQHDPVSGKHLAYYGLGRQVWAITPPAAVGGITPDAGWTLEKLPMNAAQPAPPTTPDPLQASGGTQIIGVNGKWKHADQLRAMGFVEGGFAGNVWFLLGPGWTDPRNS